jgi:hypothetical protein
VYHFIFLMGFAISFTIFTQTQTNIFLCILSQSVDGKLQYFENVEVGSFVLNVVSLERVEC